MSTELRTNQAYQSYPANFAYPDIAAKVLVDDLQSTVIPKSLSSISSSQELRLHLDLPDFGLQLASPILNISNKIDFSEIIVDVTIDSGVRAKLILRSKPVEDLHDQIQIRDLTLNFDVSDRKAHSFFFSESLYAILSLAGEVRILIPSIGINIGANFERPLPDISTMMQRRQTYFGLITIEKATGLDFKIPEFIPGEDLDAISFTYHAIMVRHFKWLCNEVGYFLPATDESFDWIKNLTPVEPGKAVYKLRVGPHEKTRTIFGESIYLGDEAIFLDDAIIVDHERILRELSMKDGHIVKTVFRPLSRKGLYFLPNAPKLPVRPWDQLTQNFINLESVLDERLVERYNDLAFSSLNPEEFESINERPTLDNNAHLIKD
jgi:hypothetical protein